MLRVGLTGELGSGKSTVARLLAQHGATLLSSDEIGRSMMQPGHPVYRAIVDHFGNEVLLPDGHLNRPELARLAFHPAHPRVEELNAIVHPAVIAEQERALSEIGRSQPNAIVVIESALIFTTRHGGSQIPWRERFDALLLVTATDKKKVDRFVARAQAPSSAAPPSHDALRLDALQRLAAQRIPPEAARQSIVIPNNGDLQELTLKVNTVYANLLEQAVALKKQHSSAGPTSRSSDA